MQQQSDTAERLLARMGTESKGVVSRVELLEAGMTPEQIRQRLVNGSLIPEFLGVYRVGHKAPSLEARYMAAVKACGERAVLSGPAAAYLYGMIKGRPPLPHVTVLKQRAVKGVITKRTRALDRRDLGEFRGIPITTVPRTLVDLAAQFEPDELARACHEAGVKYGTTPRQVEQVLERRPNATGAKKLREVLHGDIQVTLSALERRFLDLMDEANLPRPKTNCPAGSKRVDCRWAEPPLTVELDSYRYHRSRHAWEQDRKREREAYARGDQLRRYTWADVFEHHVAMLAELRPLLAGAA